MQVNLNLGHLKVNLRLKKTLLFSQGFYPFLAGKFLSILMFEKLSRLMAFYWKIRQTK